MSLKDYRHKRDFGKTQEPSGRKKALQTKALAQNTRSFVIQKHDASHLHYDFRLELDGVLKSWAVPKGPSLDPADKRLAVEVEDHPIDYATFEGSIPKGEYGGGDVIVWDLGEWVSSNTPKADLKKGHIEFELRGEKLSGRWALIRTKRGTSKPQWLLMKKKDEAAISHDEFDVVVEKPESVKTGELLPLDASATPGAKVSKKKAQAPKAKSLSKKKVSRKTTVKKKVLRKTEAKFPGFIAPQLARLVEAAPQGAEWVHEIKFDGYRAVTTLHNHKAKMFTRSGLDWTKKYSSVAKALEKLKLESAIFDGEVVWMNDDDRSDFSGLQNALKSEETDGLVYFIFDLLWLDGEDLRERPLLERKALLEDFLKKADEEHLRYSEHWTEDGPSVLAASCGLNYEGIISKQVDASYESKRAASWIKTKCLQGQELVIGGFSKPKGSRSGFGALLMGAKDEDGKFRYVGRVGTGFDAAKLKSLHQKMKALERKTSPFEVNSPSERDVTFIKPELVAQIKFTEWTADKILRHPVFEALRDDKPASQVVIEKPKTAMKKTKSKLKPKASLKSSGEKTKVSSKHAILTHPDKLLYPKAGFSKDRVATYYDKVGKLLLPHLKNRPIAMVRCPEGEGGECFFQKKLGFHKGEALKTARPKGMKGKKEELVYTETQGGLTELVQMGVLEIHAWGAKVDDIVHPDLIVFDFDPDEKVTFVKVKAAAIEIRDLLENLGLKSYVKTTGGKGLHIHVPILPEHDYDQVKEFSLAVVRHLEKKNPKLYTTNASKSKRHGRIYLDYLRNGYGATAIIPYSLRAKPTATASVPLSWSELGRLKSASAFTLVDVERRIARRKDPWLGYFKLRQRLRLK